MFAIFVGCWAFAPWKVLASAGSFVSFMGAYSIVLAVRYFPKSSYLLPRLTLPLRPQPIAAILCADYFVRSHPSLPRIFSRYSILVLSQVVKSSKYNVPELYDPKGIYYYTYGFNWRALVALCVAVPPNLPVRSFPLFSSSRTPSLTLSCEPGNDPCAERQCRRREGKVHLRRRGSLGHDRRSRRAHWAQQALPRPPVRPLSPFPYSPPSRTPVAVTWIWKTDGAPFHCEKKKRSLIAEQVLAVDVLEGLVPGYEHLSMVNRRRGAGIGSRGSEEEAGSKGKEESRASSVVMV